MTAGFDQWSFVIAAYLVAVCGALGLAGWSWITMRKAEARRNKVRDQ